MEFLIPLVVVCAVCGGLGYAIGGQKGQAGMGRALGVLLGPLGVLVAVLLPRSSGGS